MQTFAVKEKVFSQSRAWLADSRAIQIFIYYKTLKTPVKGGTSIPPFFFVFLFNIRALVFSPILDSLPNHFFETPVGGMIECHTL